MTAYDELKRAHTAATIAFEKADLAFGAAENAYADARCEMRAAQTALENAVFAVASVQQ